MLLNTCPHCALTRRRYHRLSPPSYGVSLIDLVVTKKSNVIGSVMTVNQGAIHRPRTTITNWRSICLRCVEVRMGSTPIVSANVDQCAYMRTLSSGPLRRLSNRPPRRGTLHACVCNRWGSCHAARESTPSHDSALSTYTTADLSELYAVSCSIWQGEHR